jgi:hypothetical protein
MNGLPYSLNTNRASSGAIARYAEMIFFKIPRTAKTAGDLQDDGISRLFDIHPPKEEAPISRSRPKAGQATHPNMRAIGAEFITDEGEAPFVYRRMGGGDHVTLAPQGYPLRWSIFVLQTIHVSHDPLLSSAVFLHEHYPVEVVLMLGGIGLCVIDAVELLHSTVRDRNCLLAVF